MIFKERALSKSNDAKSKNNRNLEIVKKLLKEILEESPNFTGNIQLNFHEGNLASINKSEKIK